MESLIAHPGGCHCGRVRFEVLAPEYIRVSDCNCSICSKSGYLHLTVPESRFKLLAGIVLCSSLTSRRLQRQRTLPLHARGNLHAHRITQAILSTSSQYPHCPVGERAPGATL